MSTISKRAQKKMMKLQLRNSNKKIVTKLVTEYYGENGNNVDGCGIVLVKIINRQIHFLLRKCHGIYYVPKGNRKINEGCLDGSKRELFRYTGINANKYRIISEEPTIFIYRPFYHNSGYKYRGHYVTKHMYFYFGYCDENVEPIAANEYGTYHWVKINDICNHQTFEKNLFELTNNVSQYL